MKTNERNKFDSIYKDFSERVYKAACGYMKETHLAEDVFQETFMELHKKIDQVKSETVENWLLTVVKHKSFNMLKKMAIQQGRVECFEEEAELLETDMYGNISHIEKQKEYRNLSKEIFEGLYHENKKWYEAIIRVYGFGKAQKEVAGEMGVNIGTLYSMLFRAREWVKKHYGKQYDELFH